MSLPFSRGLIDIKAFHIITITPSIATMIIEITALFYGYSAERRSVLKMFSVRSLPEAADSAFPQKHLTKLLAVFSRPRNGFRIPLTKTPERWWTTKQCDSRYNESVR